MSYDPAETARLLALQSPVHAYTQHRMQEQLRAASEAIKLYQRICDESTATIIEFREQSLRDAQRIERLERALREIQEVDERTATIIEFREQSLRDAQRIERLERALREIQEVDERSMYERCPDCDYGHQCTVSKRCIAMPHSKAGEIARSALSTDQGGADR